MERFVKLSTRLIVADLPLSLVIVHHPHPGTWNGTPVAVKVLSAACQQRLSDQLIESFKEEVMMLARLRHPNICLFLGACLDPPHRAIVTELVSRGSLWDVLRTSGLFPGHSGPRCITLPLCLLPQSHSLSSVPRIMCIVINYQPLALSHNEKGAGLDVAWVGLLAQARPAHHPPRPQERQLAHR